MKFKVKLADGAYITIVGLFNFIKFMRVWKK